MFRSIYDSDISIWSPEGRLFQVEYAMEAVKLGSTTVGIKSEYFAVIACIRKSTSELAVYQKKMIEVDKHIGVVMCGLTSDAKLLAQFMRTECLCYKFSQKTPIPGERLVNKVANKMHKQTQRYDRRPYGVGMLIATYDDLGPHIYQICPSSNYYDCKAMAIGNRFQSARTYLEKHLEQFRRCSHDDTITHSLRALQSTLPNTDILYNTNISIGVVGINQGFTILNDNEISKYLGVIETEDHKSEGDQNNRINLNLSVNPDQAPGGSGQ